MYANAELQIESAQGILVPDNAVLDTGDRQLVFVETAPGQFTPAIVRVGLRGDGQALLLRRCAEGESVVGAGQLPARLGVPHSGVISARPK